MKEKTELETKYKNLWEDYKDLKNMFNSIIEIITEQDDVEYFIFNYCEDLEHLENIYNIIRKHERIETALQQSLKREIENRKEDE